MDADPLAEQFERHRAHLTAVAVRLLGGRAEAEDAVQEAWLRLIRSEGGEIDNLRSWLTTVVSLLCLDVLRSRRARVEQATGLDHELSSERTDLHLAAEPRDPAAEVALADSVGMALLVVLDRLTPAERVAFVLHDVFALPFAEIGPIIDRSPEAAKTMASRARRRVHDSPGRDRDPQRQRRLVAAFHAASREGDFERLLELLDPTVVLRADNVAVQVAEARRAEGAQDLSGGTRGAQAVAKLFLGRAQGLELASIDGAPGAVWAPGGKPRVAFVYAIEADRIKTIDLIYDPRRIRQLDIEVLADDTDRD
ncbi:sigma-70 family RNA polymerase sigma factor [Kribbella sancticallisti]|uniref:Sigma-70 family RNA polymerase sigma factor n=1 Tax=Kribbella sancticallisti TaxID=460087 RepID=A0ABP4PHY6_9ACTN